MIFTSSVKARIFKQRRFRQLLVALLTISFLLGWTVVLFEKPNPKATITTPFEGVYWAVTTMTTVGYGDMVPLSTAGRLISITLQILGTLIFGILIAVISTYASRQQEEFYWGRLFEKINHMESEIAELKKQSNFIIKSDHQNSESQKDEPNA